LRLWKRFPQGHPLSIGLDLPKSRSKIAGPR
jgi:hypothetical protein